MAARIPPSITRVGFVITAKAANQAEDGCPRIAVRGRFIKSGMTGRWMADLQAHG